MLSYTVLAVSPAEADAYVAARLLAGWPPAEPQKSAALRRGQDYVAREYNHRWAVTFDNAAAPELIKNAIIEAAVVEAATPGSLSPQVNAASAKVLTAVEGIKWTPIAPPSGLTLEQMMKPTLTNVKMLLQSMVTQNSTGMVVV